MARREYATVKIPAELASKLDSSCKHWGYRSRAEMVDDAIRLFIQRMNQDAGNGDRRAQVRVPAPAV